MKIKEIISYLEQSAPPQYQEHYDNAGLITGQSSWECKGALICLDAIEEVVNEAKERNCNLVIVHHPIIFKGLKKINSYEELRSFLSDSYLYFEGIRNKLIPFRKKREELYSTVENTYIKND